MPVKVLDKSGSGYYSWIAEGIHYATDNGSRVISLSLGGGADSEILRNAVKYAYENGVTVIAAAGNDASSTISYPAAYDDYVIAVGATRYDESLAYYSNYGPSLDLVAPGGDLNIDQNGDGYKDGVLQNTFNPNTKRTNDFNYWFFQGTSMATPHVSGVAALLIAHGNANTPDEIRSALQETARDDGDPGRDDTYGWGIVDAYAALQWTATPNNPPIADADGPCTGIEGTVLTFDGSGSFDPDGDFLTYTWNFDDGNGNSIVNSTHIYEADGIYAVTLIVNDGEVDSDPNTTTATISDVDPIAAFSYSPTNPTAGSPVQFTDKSTTHDGIISWNWNFGDGNTSAEFEPTHTYGVPGTFMVTLEVSNDRCSGTVSHNVEILPIMPIASFADVTPACSPYTVQFVNTSQNAMTYFWDFGDGSSSNEENPEHTYYRGGSYIVRLTAIGPGGQDKYQQMVEVYQSPTAMLDVSPTTVYVNDKAVKCFNLSSYGDTYLWEFGDGETDSIFEPYHVYMEEGIYDITLHVYSENGCEDVYTLSPAVTVLPAGVLRYPTAFKPNKTGPTGGGVPGDPNLINTVFFPPIQQQIDDYHLQIFNRWGEKLFESTDINIGWDGYYKGTLCKQDVYVWQVKGRFNNGKPYRQAGDITLLH